MIKPIEFYPFDEKSWPRAQIFHYFSQMAPTGYSLTVEVDITETMAALKARGLKFFPAYLWVITSAANLFPEFKTAVVDGKPGYYSCLTPLYAQFHEDDKSISLIYNPFDDSFSGFYQGYIEKQRRYGDSHGFLPQAPDFPPPNSYTVSCLPWVKFDSFSLHTSSGAPYFFPTVEAGKIIEGERLLLPLSITAHHAACDGWHVNLFLREVERLFSNPQEWIDC